MGAFIPGKITESFSPRHADHNRDRGRMNSNSSIGNPALSSKRSNFEDESMIQNPMGCVTLRLADLPSDGKSLERWFDIEPTEACRAATGKLRLRIAFKSKTGSQPQKSYCWWSCATCAK